MTRAGHLLQTFVCLALLLVVVGAIETAQIYTAVQDPNSLAWKVIPGKVQEHAVAVASYDDTLMSTGWARLHIETNENQADNTQSFGAGYLEGFLTAQKISDHRINFWYNYFENTTTPAPVKAYFAQHEVWVRAKVRKAAEEPNQAEAAYWRNIGYVLQQMDGMVRGYNDAKKGTRMSWSEMMMLNSGGELDDLLVALGVQPLELDSMSKEEVVRSMHDRSHCSAMIKMLPDYSDFFVGHNTWSSYTLMNRIHKTYHFHLKDQAVRAQKVAFVSYPGHVHSMDDLYTLDTGLVVLETTNSVLNATLYNGTVSPQSLLTWERVVTANRLAHCAMSWIKLFARDNSGTYNNQWMVLHTREWKPRQALPDRMLMIVEQIPGSFLQEDVTKYLRNGYWSSFNRPHFPEYFDVMGYTYFRDKFNDSRFDYWTDPRAVILRREQAKVENIEDFKALMRFNQWKTDPASENDPGNAIASRFDLLVESPQPISWFRRGTHGAHDAKVVNYASSQDLSLWTVSGPSPLDNPVFSWSDSPDWKHVSRVGLPERFDFPWIKFAFQP